MKAYKFKDEREKAAFIAYLNHIGIRYCNQTLDISEAKGARISLNKTIHLIKNCSCERLQFVRTLKRFLELINELK